jgi:hypothetical protein
MARSSADNPDGDAEAEVVSGEVVPAGRAAPVARRQSSEAGTVVVKQAAAVAVGSFAAGLATVVAVRAMGATRDSRRARRARKALPIVATRTFMVDVHLIDPRR